MRNPEVCVIKTDGVNCDEEMSHAFEVAGGTPEIVHINQLREGDKNLRDYQAVAIAGGFSYGDDIASGKVLANELTSYLAEDLSEVIEEQKPIIGVCNGFQVLARTGLLPSRDLDKQTTTLTHNDAGHFICKWVDLKLEESRSKFIQPEDIGGVDVPMQIAHGEGKFETSSEVLEELESRDQVVFRYIDNPNGSKANIAGICDDSGLILGMMPHPERSIASFHPNRRLTALARETGKTIFKNIVEYTKES